MIVLLLSMLLLLLGVLLLVLMVVVVSVHMWAGGDGCNVRGDRGAVPPVGIRRHRSLGVPDPPCPQHPHRLPLCHGSPMTPDGEACLSD
jgi:hypothetical protein